MKHLGLTVFLFTQTVLAATEPLADSLPEPCEIKNFKSLEVSLLASNLANFNTTRTPEGGAYKRQRLVCKDKSCQIEKFANVIIKYQPGHPDSDENGYVKYPDIDLQEEINALRVVQRELESAKQNCESATASQSSRLEEVR